LRAALLALSLASLVGGCYAPNPKDKGWTCSAETKGLCPSGLNCDFALGLCVKTLNPDMGATDIGSPFDFTLQPTVRSCDERVRQGAFSSPTNLAAVNTGGDERGLAITPNGQRLYFMDGAGNLHTAAITAGNPKATGPSSPVTLTGLVGTLEGGSFAVDGSYVLAASNGGTTALFTATQSSATAFTVGAAQLPSATCPFTDPAVYDTNPADKQLFVSYPLDGCGGSPMIAQGKQGKQIGAFVGALATRGFRSPSLLPGGVTMLIGSTGASPKLYWAERPSDDREWSGPLQLPLGGIGAPSGETQAVVSPDCKTLYFVSTRGGGKGGADLWAADIAAQ
jgi:hypothetical protein